MKEVVIGFLGCGNVGGGVWSLLTGFSREIAHRDSLSIRIKRVLVRDVNKTRACGVPHELLTTNADDVVSDPEISIVVEFMGGEQPATDYMLRALENGKTVVTANKVAIALNWHRLQGATTSVCTTKRASAARFRLSTPSCSPCKRTALIP